MCWYKWNRHKCVYVHLDMQSTRVVERFNRHNHHNHYNPTMSVYKLEAERGKSEPPPSVWPNPRAAAFTSDAPPPQITRADVRQIVAEELARFRQSIINEIQQATTAELRIFQTALTQEIRHAAASGNAAHPPTGWPTWADQHIAAPAPDPQEVFISSARSCEQPYRGAAFS